MKIFIKNFDNNSDPIIIFNKFDSEKDSTSLRDLFYFLKHKNKNGNFCIHITEPNIKVKIKKLCEFECKTEITDGYLIDDFYFLPIRLTNYLEKCSNNFLKIDRVKISKIRTTFFYKDLELPYNWITKCIATNKNDNYKIFRKLNNYWLNLIEED